MSGFPLSADEILSGYRSRLVAVERRAPLTAETYLGEIRFFLEYGLSASGKGGASETISGNVSDTGGKTAGWLLEAGTSFLVDYLEERRKNIGPRSAAKAVSARVLFSVTWFPAVSGKTIPRRYLKARGGPKGFPRY